MYEDNRRKIINEIIAWLSIYAVDIENHAKINDLAAVHYAENNIREIINALLGYQLKNANVQKFNSPGFDLIDEAEFICVQITATKTAQKVSDSIDQTRKVLSENGLKWKFRIMFLGMNSEKIEKLRKRSFPVIDFIEFNPATDIWDFNWIIKKLDDLDINKLYEFYEICEKVFGKKKSNILFKRLKLHLIQNDTNSGTYVANELSELLYTSIQNKKNSVLYSSKKIDSKKTVTALYDCLHFYWRKGISPDFMLCGVGGSGKTVMLQQTAKLLLDDGIVAIYIPLNNLSGKESLTTYMQKYILRGMETALDDYQMSCSELPMVVLFLDGINEIVDENRRNVENDIQENWMGRPGFEIIISGRDDITLQWYKKIEVLQVNSLSLKQIHRYLVAMGRQTHINMSKRLQTVLSNPLMLCLYTQNIYYEESLSKRKGIDWIKASDTPGTIIWNFLQCQIGKIAQAKNRTNNNVYTAIIAVMIVASWFGWKMQSMQKHYVDCNIEDINEWFSEAEIFYNTHCKDNPFFKKIRSLTQLNIKEWDWNQDYIYQMLFDKMVLFKLTSDNKIYFIHQQFRDCFSAICMINDVRANVEESSLWRMKPTQEFFYVHMLLADLLKLEQIQTYIDNMRGVICSVGSYAMYNLIEIYKLKKDFNLQGFNFERLDLRNVSLKHCGLDNVEKKNFEHSLISDFTFMPDGHNEPIVSLDCLPQSNIILSISNDSIKYWDVLDNKCLFTIKDGKKYERNGGFSCAALNYDKTRMLIGSYRNKIWLWNIEKQELLKEIITEESECIGLSFNRAGNKFAAAFNSGFGTIIKVFSFNATECIASTSVSGYCGQMIFHSKQNLLLVTEHDSVFLWDYKKDLKYIVVKNCVNRILGVTPPKAMFISNETKILTHDYYGYGYIWDMETKKIAHIFSTCPYYINDIAISSDEKTIVATSSDNYFNSENNLIIVWDALTGKQLNQICIDSRVGNIIIPSDNEIAIIESISEDGGIVNIIDLNNGIILKSFVAHKGTYGRICCIAFDCNNQYLLTTSNDSTMKMWNIVSAELIHTFERSYDCVSCEYICDKLGITLTGGFDCVVREWDNCTGRQIKILDTLKKFEGYNYIYDIYIVDEDEQEAKAIIILDSKQQYEWNLVTGKCKDVTSQTAIYIKQHSFIDIDQTKYNIIPNINLMDANLNYCTFTNEELQTIVWKNGGEVKNCMVAKTIQDTDYVILE